MMNKQRKMPAQTNALNLPNLFKTVASSLGEQRTSLNAADPYNHDHGDNMVEVFDVISQAMQAKRNADPADQLLYASQLLRQRKSGSAQVYAQGLSQASQEFKGQKQLTADNAINLIQALLGGGQPSTATPQAGMGNLLGSLLGGSAPTQQQTGQGGMEDLIGSLLGGSTQQGQGGAGDLLGSLLGGTTQQGQTQQAGTGLDVGDLLNAGMEFMNTKARGGSTAEALTRALVSGSAMGGTQHRAQSGTLVAGSLLQALGGMLGNK
jgi:hypothetical protein